MIEQQVMDSSSQQPIVPSDFQNANAIIDSISTPKDSQPTKLKVKNFKNRVFHLLKIYTTQSANINPLIQCLKQDMFFHEPEKMQELLQNILNKENVTLENLQQLLEYYKVILLYKCDQKTNDTVTPQFLRLMKKISTLDQELTNSTLISMLKAFLYERKCKLNVNFFFYFFRKYEHSQEIKKIFIEKCQESLQDEKLRNAQKKQLNKILQRIDKTFRVNQNKVKKQQHMQIEEEEADSNDVKATNKKKSNLTKVEKKEQVKKVKGNEKIEEEGEQGEEKKSKKQIPIEQQQKLQRIKQNKKNKRKQNQKSQPQQPNQDTHKNNHANKEQKKNNDNNQKNNNQQKGNNENKTVDEPKKAHGNKFANKKPNNPSAENSQKHSESKERPHQKEGHSNSKPKFDKGAKRPQQDRSQSKPKFDKAAKRPQQDNRSQSKPKFNKDFKKPQDNHSRSKPKFDKGNKRPQTPNSK